MSKLRIGFAIGVMISGLVAASFGAGGGADYGRGLETDPIATAAATAKFGADANLIDLTYSASTVVTNGQAVSVTHPVMVLNSSLGTNGATNVITLANPGVKGRVAWIYNVGTSNVLGVAKTGNFVSTALNVAAGDMAQLVAVATNQWAGK